MVRNIGCQRRVGCRGLSELQHIQHVCRQTDPQIGSSKPRRGGAEIRRLGNVMPFPHCFTNHGLPGRISSIHPRFERTSGSSKPSRDGTVKYRPVPPPEVPAALSSSERQVRADLRFERTQAARRRGEKHWLSEACWLSRFERTSPYPTCVPAN